MQTNLFQFLKPKLTINKAFLRQKPIRTDIDRFKVGFNEMLDRIKDAESEEFHKNLIIDFFTKTYLFGNHYINTKGRNDLVIHTGKEAKTPVGVIIEVKKVSNKAEMITKENLNKKAFHELILYYLRERITNQNLSVKHLIITNSYDWFVFDAQTFDRIFAQSKKLVAQFKDFENGKLADTRTSFFYNEIAAKFIDTLETENSNNQNTNKAETTIAYTHFSVEEYRQILKNNNKEEDNKLIALFKLLSPEHLLKLSFANDSNTLDKPFYNELLHIIGLTEVKKGNTKVIERKAKKDQNTGSLLEDAIIQLEMLNKIPQINNLKNRREYGKTHEEKIFNVALELCINWINRILFAKLLEAQIINYHKGNKDFAYLNKEKIVSYGALNEFFFRILAVQLPNRHEDVKAFDYVPYMNSSLFEPSELENQTIFISNLRNGKKVPIYENTVLKDQYAKQKKGELSTLEYLFEFLNAYDFSSEGSEEIQEDNKTLINAAVLGLIFEKINGYQDGSFFTPGFITMYMSKESIRRAVVQKFNTIKKWNCTTFEELYNKIEDRQEANRIIDAMKICDPAVGSGHFLVSALNELIAIKSDLRILRDVNGQRLKEYFVTIVNDELVITDEDGDFFEYKPKGKESHRVQEAIFQEKRRLIENCLFGVDINSNSVKICRLRLWIELLKNAYYIDMDFKKGLQTLPNLDINIKTGNSLISRFAIDEDLSKALKKSKYTIDDYKKAVSTYHNSKSREEKREMEKIISDIKADFRTEIAINDSKIKQQRKLIGELSILMNQTSVFEQNKKEKKEKLKKQNDLEKQIEKITNEIEDAKENVIYHNAFEWRFEFPEVLDKQGKFLGFDLIIANPPYVYRNVVMNGRKQYFDENYYNTSGNYDLYKFFLELFEKLMSVEGYGAAITNSSFLLQTSFEKTREFLLYNTSIKILAPLGGNVFDEATVDSAICIFKKTNQIIEPIQIVVPTTAENIKNAIPYSIDQDRFKKNQGFVFDYLLKEEEHELVKKLFSTFPTIETEYDFGVGINTAYIKNELVSDKKENKKYHKMVAGTGISRYGEVETKGFIRYDKEFVKSRGKLGRTLPAEKFFTNPKILIVRTRNLSLKRRIIATIDYDKKYNLNRLSNIVSKSTSSLEGLLAVLNSKLFNWLYSKRFFDYEVKPVYLRNSPLCNTNNKKLISLSTKILSLKKQNQENDTTRLEKEIDLLVYELYGLSKSEIEIIEREEEINKIDTTKETNKKEQTGNSKV